MAPKTIMVEIAYAEAKKQILVRVSVPLGATVLEAITASTVLSQFPHLAGAVALSNNVGIFGKTRTLDTVLQAGDRVEIYRALMIDPKEGRRLKAAVTQRQKAQAFDEKKRKQKVARKAKVLLYKKEKNP